MFVPSRSFILSRPSRRKLKQSGILKERVFGCDLGEHLLNSGREIPMVLKCCAEFIEEYGIVDGIYRLSGITSNIQKLRNAFDEDRVPALVEDEAIRQDMHAVSSLLKMYFRELPNPLCTYQLYDQFVNAVQGPDNLRVPRMREVVQQLPPPHFRTLEYLTRHLARVAEHNASTGMTAKNVAIVWAPNLLRCKELEFGGVAALQGVGVQAVVTECLVRYVDLIFSDKPPAAGASAPLTGDELTSGALKRTRPKSLAISTPTKLLSLEEARNRALQLASSQNDTQYIEVGGGPASLPPKYHTVIELPNGDGRKRGHSLKHKKSPLGWKSLFAKPKANSSPSGSKAQRKGSSASTVSTVSMPAVPTSSQPITYIRPRLRPVKSAESLVPSNRNSSAGESSASPEGAKRGETSLPENSATAADDSGERLATDDGEGSMQDGSLSRCHSRSVSHDSYFRLLVTSGRGAKQVDPLDEEADNSAEDCESHCQDRTNNEAIYAEISKPASRGSRLTPLDSTPGSEFGRNMNLTAVEEPHSGSSKMSLNDLSHLDDSELNMMGSREMLAMSKKTADNSCRHSAGQPARPASADDSIIDDSARGMPMNAEQIDDKGNWAASNPAYELFCIQAEVHHQRIVRSPSPDNTDAQMPDMPSEVAMDGDNDSLINVGTEEYSSAEVTGSDRESCTLHGNLLNDVYENVNVAETRQSDVESSKRPASPEVYPYENFADNHAYAMVRVSSAQSVTYENVIDPVIDEEEYEPIEPPSNPPLSYENIDQQSYENVDRYESLDHASYENIDQEQPNYENLDQPGYENIEEDLAAPIDTYENVILRETKAKELVNVYEDVIPPPPNSAETEEVIYHQVKVLRQSIQEVNELLREDPTVLQLALGEEYPAPEESPKKLISKFVMKDIDPPKSVPLSVSLPSLLNSNKVKQQTNSLPPTPVYSESEVVSSKRRIESEIGRELLRERRIRNEIESSRRSEGNLFQPSRPALPVKTNPKKISQEIIKVPNKKPEALSRPMTLETSFDYESSPVTLRRASSPPSSSSPLSPVSPSSEGRNFAGRKTSVKELLNKFQTDNTARVPTSPIKPAPPVKPVEESKKDKENIDLTLTPPKSEIIEIESEKETVIEESDSKEALLRQKPAVQIDMSDPRTRLRIERYKEERRSFLREKYKSESFRSDGKDDAVIVRLKQKAGSPTGQQEPTSLGSDPGLIEEDINVKERAAQWAQSSPPAVTHRSCAEAVAPKRIRDMAAMFEKESP